MLYQEGILNETMSPDMALIYAYGTYLMNGGTKEGFMSLDFDDVQILLSTVQCTERAREMRMMKNLADLVVAMFKGGN